MERKTGLKKEKKKKERRTDAGAAVSFKFLPSFSPKSGGHESSEAAAMKSLLKCARKKRRQRLQRVCLPQKYKKVTKNKLPLVF